MCRVTSEVVTCIMILYNIKKKKTHLKVCSVYRSSAYIVNVFLVLFIVLNLNGIYYPLAPLELNDLNDNSSLKWI